MTTIETGLDARPDAAAARAAVAATLPALLTTVFGLALIFSIGFAHVTVLHNGAHDTRHANGFPCH